MENSNVYIILFKDKDYFKIGKADNVIGRIAKFGCYWGELDYGKSYVLSVPSACVFKIEKALHSLLYDYSVKQQDGDGKTEFFHLDGLFILKEYIYIYLKHKPNCSFTEGIKLNAKATSRRPLLAKESKTLEEESKSLSGFFLKMRFLAKWILFLDNKQSKVQFAYDYDSVAGSIFFTFVCDDPDSVRRRLAKFLWYDIDCLQTKKFQAIGKFWSYIYSEDDVVLVEISARKHHSFIVDHFKTIIDLLLKIPGSSKAFVLNKGFEKIERLRYVETH